MPGLDSTGPMSQGAQTGRKLGRCNASKAEETVQFFARRGRCGEGRRRKNISVEAESQPAGRGAGLGRCKRRGMGRGKNYNHN